MYAGFGGIRGIRIRTWENVAFASPDQIDASSASHLSSLLSLLLLVNAIYIECGSRMIQGATDTRKESTSSRLFRFCFPRYYRKPRSLSDRKIFSNNSNLPWSNFNRSLFKR